MEAGNQVDRLCPHCQHKNASQASYCAQCGYALSDPASDDLSIKSVLQDAALSIEEVIQNPAVQNAGRKIGQTLRQAGADIDRAARSEETKRAARQAVAVAQRAAQAVKDSVSDGATATTAVGSSSVSSAVQPCLRCGTPNRRESRFCASCGAPFDDQPSSLTYAVAHVSDVGQVRSNNEDSVRVWSFAGHSLPAWALLVADGMGGAASGEVASSCVAAAVEQEIVARWNASDPKPEDLERWLRVILRQANASVYRQAQSDPALHGMGSTATLAWLEGDRVAIAHVGDSRAYLIPPSGPGWQITRDHTMVNLLAAIGEMTAEEAAASPENNLLYRAIGVAPKVEIDSYIRRMQVGDRLVLCSDGLTRHVPDEELIAIARQHIDPANACQALVAWANQRGGEDNISIVVALAKAGASGSS
ncbi:MAG: protein phosphatase 2C domain-containing protein [Caldilineaceae bacterium]|nr:protein phosphatase 2C domain-containing protein [Caldilineaceae bacterium]